jgi:hypothetical protein
MRHEVASDLKRSSTAFTEIVWPRIAEPWFGGGEIIPVEAVTQEVFSKHLDTLAGVDAWLIRAAFGITAIASRVQFVRGSRPFNTFTIRAWRSSGLDTELQKRLRSLNEPDRGYLYPHVTIQAYLQSGTNEFLSVAAILTRDLFAHVDKYRDKTNGDQRSGFKVACWRQLRELDTRIRVMDAA